MSSKSETNKKWTSNEEYRKNYDRIYGEKVVELEDPCLDCELGKIKALGCICQESLDYELLMRERRD